MFLHPQLFQESCCNVRDSGLARAYALWTYTLNQMNHISSDDGVNAGAHSSQQGNATSAILVGRAGMF